LHAGREDAVERSPHADDVLRVVEIDGPVLAADVALARRGLRTRVHARAADAQVRAGACHDLTAGIAGLVADPDVAILAEVLARVALHAAVRVDAALGAIECVLPGTADARLIRRALTPMSAFHAVGEGIDIAAFGARRAASNETAQSEHIRDACKTHGSLHAHPITRGCAFVTLNHTRR